MPSKERYIRQRTNGTWEARIKVGTKEDGSADVPSVYFRSRSEAREYVQRVLADRGRGVEHKRTVYTIGTWADECMTLYANTLQDSTIVSYRSMIARYISPSPLARVQVEDASRRDIQKWVNALRGRDGSVLSPKTVRNAVGVLTWLFSRAVEAEIIQRVPDTAHLRLPASVKPERKVLSPADAHALLRATDSSRLHAALVVDACTGLRRSELLGLMWSDIDMATGEYRVKRKVTQDAETGAAKIVPVLKTASAARVGMLPHTALDALRKHKVLLMQERLKAGVIYQDLGLVFSDEVGRVTHPQAFSAAVRRLSMRTIGKDIGMHQFRHLVATALIRAHLDDATIAAALGHRSADFTRRQYADVYEDSRVQVAAVTEQMIQEKSAE